MVESWPADTDDSSASSEWGWEPKHNLDKGLKDYLIPIVKKLYQ